MLTISNTANESDLEYQINFEKIETPSFRSDATSVKIKIPQSDSNKPKDISQVKQPFAEPSPFKTLTVPSGLASIRSLTKVLLLSPDPNISDLYACLVGFNDLAVSIFPVQLLDRISMKDLTPYDVILVTNNYRWEYEDSTPSIIGDLLADYIDIGGRVILTNYS